MDSCIQCSENNKNRGTLRFCVNMQMLYENNKWDNVKMVIDTGAIASIIPANMLYNCVSERDLIRSKVQTCEIGGSVLGKDKKGNVVGRALYYKLNLNNIRLSDSDGRYIDFPFGAVWVTFDDRVSIPLLGMDYLQLLNLTYLANVKQFVINKSPVYEQLYKKSLKEKWIFRKPDIFKHQGTIDIVTNSYQSELDKTADRVLNSLLASRAHLV